MTSFSQLNDGLSGTGLTASLSSANGSLQISGSGSFAVAVDAAPAQVRRFKRPSPTRTP